MIERQQDLRKTPENRQEKQPHICPTCEREFKKITDYPKVFIASVSVITPADVPAEITYWGKEDLLVEAPEKGREQGLVPAEVLEYFRANPDEDKLVHSDSYIYHRPFCQTQEHRRQKEAHPERYNGSIKWVGEDHYKREFNYAPTIKALLEQNVPLKKYLESLQQMVGQEIPKRKVFPKWQQHYFPRGFQIPAGFGVPDADNLGLLLRFSKEGRNTTEYRVYEIGIWGDGPSQGAGGPTIIKILPIGALKYEGRINSA